MEKNDYYIGLELGSSSVKAIAGFMENEQVHVLQTVEVPCLGLENGLIIDQDETIKSLKTIISRLEKALNTTISDVALCLPPYSLLCIEDTGSTNTIDGSDIIRHVDTTNILTAMRKRTMADNDLKILDIVPEIFILDNGDRYYNEPLGKVSKVLSIKASIYAMSERVINQFIGCVKKISLNVKYAVIAPYAGALFLAGNKAIPNSYILVDIGHSLTTISHIDHATKVMDSAIIKYGGYDITRAIGERFNISYEKAEELKVTYGIDHNLNFNCYIYDKINLDDLAEVITKKLNSLLESVSKAIKEFGLSSEKLPLVLTGGTTWLNQIRRIFADELDVDVVEYNLLTIGARDYSLINTLGLIKYCSMQPKINEEETITTSVNRISQKQSRNYRFDEEL